MLEKKVPPQEDLDLTSNYKSRMKKLGMDKPGNNN
jgi:hypothetical protein